MTTDLHVPVTEAPRQAAFLMRPERLAALQPSRLSASRSLVNAMARDGWEIELDRFDLDERGRGEFVYRVAAGAQAFHFVGFSYEPKTSGRTPRIIGEHWDMMGALVEGEPTREGLEQTRREMPKLYAGRAAPGTLVWCRANRSLRAFDHVVGHLAAGGQPDAEVLGRVCYLMRNIGLDGNGTFGTKSFLAYGPDHALRLPYWAQMLAAYLMRELSFDLVEHLARAASPSALPLAPPIKRFLGLGNASGLGLVLWVHNHPKLVDRWIAVREQALHHAMGMPVVDGSPELTRLIALLERCRRHRSEDRIDYATFTPSASVARDLELLRTMLEGQAAEGSASTYGDVCSRVEPHVCAEAYETLCSLLIEIDPAATDALLSDLVLSETFETAPDATVGELLELVDTEYPWALAIPQPAPRARRYVWYKSENAEEPRRGPVEEVPPAFNLALDLPGDVRQLLGLLRAAAPGQTVAEFLLDHPGQRACLERIQGLCGRSYHSPHADVMDEGFVPAHIIRLVNAAFYGIDKTKDYRQRLLRGILFHGAPTRTELGDARYADWFCPPEPVA